MYDNVQALYTGYISDSALFSEVSSFQRLQGLGTCLVRFHCISNSVEGADYTFYNRTIVFNGSYSDGDSECVLVTCVAHADNAVEGTETLTVIIEQIDTPVTIFIIDSNCELNPLHDVHGTVCMAMIVCRFEGWVQPGDVHCVRVSWSG